MSLRAFFLSVPQTGSYDASLSVAFVALNFCRSVGL
jgi:hypothetical protein